MFANVEILMDGGYFGAVIAIGTGTLGEPFDSKIFFYVDSKEELQSLMNEDNGQDFVVTNVFDYFENAEDML